MSTAPYWDGENWIGPEPHPRRFYLDEEDDIHERCVSAYRRHCIRNGFTYQQPDSMGYYLNGFYTLSNARGVLSTFRVYAGHVRLT